MKLPPPPERMLKVSAWILAILLCIAVLIMWVPGAFINPTFFQVGLFLVIAFWALRLAYRPYAIIGSFPLIPLSMAACWGVLQLAAHTTVSRWETSEATITWTTNLAVFLLTLQVCQSSAVRNRLLNVLLIFALAITVVSILQYFSKPDLVLWVYYDGFGSRFGPFENRDRYAAYAELMLPLALLFALKHARGQKALFYTGIAGTLFAAIIAGGSRAGAIISVVEIVVVFLAGRKGQLLRHARLRATGVKFALFAAIFTAIVGYSATLKRFHDPDPYATRREVLISSVVMTLERPWLGFGLGNFSNAYPEHAVLDLNKFMNQAHNDWVQWAAEGGIPFFVILLSVVIWLVPRALKSLWGIGLLAVLTHSFVDFPLQAPVIGFWVFTLLGALAAESEGLPLARSGPT